MLNITPPDYKFCPLCGSQLSLRSEDHTNRKFCPNCHWVFYPRAAAAVGAIIVQADQVLLVQRAREPYKGTWMFPAGFIDYGEHPTDTLKREVHEEVGLEVTASKLIDVYLVDDDPREPYGLIYFYRTETNSSIITNIDPSENLSIAWHPIPNPPPIGFHIHQQIMTLLQQGKI